MSAALVSSSSRNARSRSVICASSAGGASGAVMRRKSPSRRVRCCCCELRAFCKRLNVVTKRPYCASDSCSASCACVTMKASNNICTCPAVIGLVPVSLCAALPMGAGAGACCAAVTGHVDAATTVPVSTTIVSARLITGALQFGLEQAAEFVELGHAQLLHGAIDTGRRDRDGGLLRVVPLEVGGGRREDLPHFRRRCVGPWLVRVIDVDGGRRCRDLRR